MGRNCPPILSFNKIYINHTLLLDVKMEVSPLPTIRSTWNLTYRVPSPSNNNKNFRKKGGSLTLLQITRTYCNHLHLGFKEYFAKSLYCLNVLLEKFLKLLLKIWRKKHTILYVYVLIYFQSIFFIIFIRLNKLLKYIYKKVTISLIENKLINFKCYFKYSFLVAKVHDIDKVCLYVYQLSFKHIF